jgi:hypothetical protein
MKYLATAKITSPSAVAAEVASRSSGKVHPGAIFCTCPELGFEGDNLFYCRYGLGIPFVHVKVGDKVWVEPTIGDRERLIYVGFADYSQTAIYLAKNKSSEPTEHMVLGDILNSFLQGFIDALLNASSLGQNGGGPVVLDPALKLVLTNLKSVYLTTEATNILSKLGYLDKDNS